MSVLFRQYFDIFFQYIRLAPNRRIGRYQRYIDGLTIFDIAIHRWIDLSLLNGHIPTRHVCYAVLLAHIGSGIITGSDSSLVKGCLSPLTLTAP